MTMHYVGDSKISSAERDSLLRQPAIELTGFETSKLAIAAERTYKEFSAWIKPRITKERAERIRLLRCDEGWSYRAIAGMSHLEWGADWEPINNQLAGVALCEAAASLLSEDMYAWPWQANAA